MHSNILIRIRDYTLGYNWHFHTYQFLDKQYCSENVNSLSIHMIISGVIAHFLKYTPATLRRQHNKYDGLLAYIKYEQK
jgi:hypothetical protein